LKGYSHLYLLRRDPLPSREIGLEPQLAVQRLEERGKKQFGFLAKNNRGKLVCRGLEFQISFQNNKELILSTEQQAQKPVGIRGLRWPSTRKSQLGSWNGVE